MTALHRWKPNVNASPFLFTITRIYYVKVLKLSLLFNYHVFYEILFIFYTSSRLWPPYSYKPRRLILSPQLATRTCRLSGLKLSNFNSEIRVIYPKSRLYFLRTNNWLRSFIPYKQLKVRSGMMSICYPGPNRFFLRSSSQKHPESRVSTTSCVI